jgi:hypothetical protein
MTYYIEHGSHTLSCFWRPNGTLAVRLQRLKHKHEALFIEINKVLIIANRLQKPIWTLRVQAFVPHTHYGGFVRSGHVVCADVQAFDDSKACTWLP